MSEGERMAFRAREDWELALTLRRYDDAAKRPGLEVPALEDYRELLAATVRRTRGLTA